MTLRWTEVRDIIKDDDRGKRDKLVSPTELHWTTTQGELLASADGAKGHYLSPWAEADLCNWLGVPVRYFRECPAELKRLQVEYLIRNRLSEKVRWRLRLRKGMVRAFASEHYQPFDNGKVVSLWEKKGDPELFDYELMLDDTFFFLRVLPWDEAFRQDRLGGLVTGIFIRNSEVGRSALAMGATIYRLICKNGLVEVLDAKPPLYQRHIWIDEAELSKKLDGSVAGALELAQRTTGRLKKARGVSVDLEAIVGTLYRFKLRERVQQAVIDSFVSEGDYSAFGMVNALTATARDLPPYERHQLEGNAWRFLATVTGE